MADLDTVSPVVWPKWCYTSKSLSFNLKKIIIYRYKNIQGLIDRDPIAFQCESYDGSWSSYQICAVRIGGSLGNLFFNHSARDARQ